MRSAQIARSHLVERVAAQRAVAIIAPSGYGKSVLAEVAARELGLATVTWELPRRTARDAVALVGSLRRALAGAGLRAMADALAPAGGDLDAAVEQLLELLRERADPVLFVIEEIHHAAGPAAAPLRRFGALAEPHRVVLIGQEAPDWLPADVPALGARDLAFSAAEAVELGRALRRPLDPANAESVVRATAGWPAAVTLAVEAGLTDAAALAHGLDGLVASVLSGGDRSLRATVAALASVPLLSPAVAQALAGAGSLERLAASGIPLRERADGWLEVPEPIREAAAQGATLDDARLSAAAGVYFDAGAAQVALNLLVERNAAQALVRTLSGRRWQELQEFDPAELRSLLAIVPGPLLDANPRLMLVLARAANAAVEIVWQGELLERAAASPAVAALAPLAREIDAERAGLASIHGDVSGVERLAQGVLTSVTPDEPATRARALAALGRVRAFQRTAASMAEAERLYTEAVTLARVSGERELLAGTLLTLGYSVHFARGELAAAAQRLREAADAAPAAGRGRAATLTFLSDALMYAGELDEADAVLREVAETGRRLRDQGILGYHAWMKAAIASRRGDAESLATWLADAERHPGDWFGHPTGIEFLAEAVDWLGRIGDHARAAEYLARVEQRCAADAHEDVDQIAVMARAVHNARAGDADGAEPLLVAVLASEQLPPRDAWRMHLLRGLAALRRGDEAAAASHSARAFEEAMALGRPELPAIHEPDAVERLLPLARRTRAAAVRSVDRATPSLSVRVLGGFAVAADGRAADPPPGRPATLVKLLAVSGHPVALDEAVEALWPEVDPEVGRARLRNVLTRIRQGSGELIRRDGGALALAPDVAVDAAEFEREARAALAGRGDESVALARRAVGRYAGELLPADRYDDYTVAPRERLAQLQLALIDRLAADAERDGDVDEALGRYAEAIAAAPLDEHRYERAAALALRAGRRQRARELVEQAQRMLDDLGVGLSDELARVAREVEATEARR